jgi:hypothetical protein
VAVVVNRVTYPNEWECRLGVRPSNNCGCEPHPPTADNALYGTPACASPVNNDLARGEWGWDGFVISVRGMGSCLESLLRKFFTSWYLC